MQEKGRGCVCMRACFSGKSETASDGICVFWTVLAGFPSAVNSNRAVSL